MREKTTSARETSVRRYGTPGAPIALYLQPGDARALLDGDVSEAVEDVLGEIAFDDDLEEADRV